MLTRDDFCGYLTEADCDADQRNGSCKGCPCREVAGRGDKERGHSSFQTEAKVRSVVTDIFSVPEFLRWK